ERGLGRAPSGGLLIYLTLGVLLGVAWYGPRVLGVALAESHLLRNSLLGLGWGVAFHHYLVDGRIWRVRRSREVARALDSGAMSRCSPRPPSGRPSGGRSPRPCRGERTA